jgi:hypothetical protein
MFNGKEEQIIRKCFNILYKEFNSASIGVKIVLLLSLLHGTFFDEKSIFLVFINTILTRVFCK